MRTRRAWTALTKMNKILSWIRRRKLFYLLEVWAQEKVKDHHHQKMPKARRKV
jgi:hypothetical protein